MDSGQSLHRSFRLVCSYTMHSCIGTSSTGKDTPNIIWRATFFTFFRPFVHPFQEPTWPASSGWSDGSQIRGEPKVEPEVEPDKVQFTDYSR